MIIYEDEWIVVVDKPHGVPTQPDRRSETPDASSVESVLKQQYRYVALHHRLDQPASGLLVCAVHRRANRSLAASFRDHQAVRTYLAVLWGTAAAAEWRRDVAGRPAHTTLSPAAASAGLTAARLTPHTGRKHQLRIHAALAGHPICGDRRHGGDAGRRWPRLALHAHQLQIAHPVTGEPMQWTSPIPDDLGALWAEAGGA
ncbi:MAG: RluA family pseudouridine synthase [Myxococcales bacterium]|nr:RluA family pseudouridine synthase [Myxococcales bacterium]